MVQPFQFTADPDLPGWFLWHTGSQPGFNRLLGPMHVRLDPAAPESRAFVRMGPDPSHANLMGVMHGGAVMTFIDVSLFGAGGLIGLVTPGTATTVDLSVQFVAGARLDAPLICEVERVRAARQLVFLRGQVRQEQGGEDGIVTSYSAILRRPAPPTPEERAQTIIASA